MSNKRKSEKAKAYNKRLKDRMDCIQNYNNLSRRVKELDEEIVIKQRENRKQFHVRNLRVFKSTCNFLMPFVISSGVTVGVFKLCGGGLPFYEDVSTKYKLSSLDYKKNCYAEMDETYVERHWYSNPLPSNSLTVYTPWKYEGDRYLRFKRVYELEKLENFDLLDAVLNNDFNYINENLRKYEEEIQFSNNIDNIEQNSYLFEADLCVLDKRETLIVPETAFKNTSVTVVEVIIVLVAGAIGAFFRNFEYIDDLRRINRNYREQLEKIQDLKREYKEASEKLLILSKKVEKNGCKKL